MMSGRCPKCGWDTIVRAKLSIPSVALKVIGPEQRDKLFEMERKLWQKGRDARNPEAATRAATDKLYTWETEGIKASKESGKQYQVPLTQNLHMDVPGMESFLINGAALMCLPIAFGMKKIVEQRAREMLEE
jgi:hypothetical protein